MKFVIEEKHEGEFPYVVFFTGELSGIIENGACFSTKQKANDFCQFVLKTKRILKDGKLYKL